jgi:hypothetical protein
MMIFAVQKTSETIVSDPLLYGIVGGIALLCLVIAFVRPGKHQR